MRLCTCLALVAWCAEPADEGLQLFDALALVAIGGFQLLAALGLLLQILLVIARIEVDALVPDFGDTVDGDVEEIAVVRDQDEGERIVVEIALQPVAGFEIEVVGGLVEQQQIRLLQQQFREREPHLPAAGELFGAAGPVLFAKSESGQHGAHLRFNGVTVTGAEFGVELLEAVGDGGIFRPGGIEFAHLVHERFHLGLHVAEVGEHRHALGKDAASGQRQAVLGKVPGAGSTGARQIAIVERIQAAQHLHERGLAGAIGAHQAGAFARGDQPIDVFEEDFGAEAFSGRGQLNHR